MDQIISNFIPYNNPYIILSWKVPNEIAASVVPQEIRSEVTWDGGVTLSYPTDIAANEKYRIVGDTAFTIKGWLFPYAQSPVSNIYTVQANFRASSLITTYDELSGDTLVYPVSTGLINETESFTLSSNPQFTNITWQNTLFS
jgi:hypothetical protein